jgi:IS30 family transposase
LDPFTAQTPWVCQRIKDDTWTPEQAAGHSRVAFPDDPAMRVSHETVYAWGCDPADKHHRLPEYLPRAHLKRRKRGGRRVHPSGIGRRVSIHHRPADVDTRSVSGHWEGDSIEEPRQTSPGIHTEVERATRYLKAVKVPQIDSFSGLAAQRAIFSPLPAAARKPATLDNGREHHLHFGLVEAPGMPAWFADPYSSWQRGTNEHFNGQLRRRLPKSTDFDTFTDNDLAWVVNKINNRFLKCPGWHTPTQAFTKALAQLDSA